MRPVDDTSTPPSSWRTMPSMDLEHWTDLDLAYLLAFGTHPELAPAWKRARVAGTARAPVPLLQHEPERDGVHNHSAPEEPATTTNG